jgi:hypothetical protein
VFASTATSRSHYSCEHDVVQKSMKPNNARNHMVGALSMLHLFSEELPCILVIVILCFFGMKT